MNSADSALPLLPIPEPCPPAPDPPKPKRQYTFTLKARAAAMENLKKAWAAPKQLRHRSTPLRLAASRANLSRAFRSNCALDSPAYATCFRHGVTACDLHRSARLCGESRDQFQRHVEAFRRALPLQNQRQQHGARGLAEIVWRHARVWGGRGHSERLQFYYWLGQAASRPQLFAHSLDPAERRQWLETKVTEVFRLDAWDRGALEEQSEKIRHQAKRIARAWVEELTGQPDREFYTVFKAQRGIAKLLDRPGEMIGNPFRAARAVQRAVRGDRDSGSGLQDGRVLAANPETRNSNPGSERRTEDEMVQCGLARLMTVHGGPLPDPLNPEDFARHLRICKLALGCEAGIEDGQSKRDVAEGAGQSSIVNLPSSMTEVVNQFAESTWARLGVFATAAERERQQAREACERAARGERFTPPRPQPPGAFDRERDDVDDWLDAAGAYLADPLPEEHHQAEAMLGAALAGNDEDDDEVLAKAAVANLAVEEAFARLRGHGLKMDDSKKPG